MPGFIGLPEIMLLALLALLLFGPKRLPEMGRGLGKGMREFKDSIGGSAGEHGFDIHKLVVPEESTSAPVEAVTVPTVVAATVPAEHKTVPAEHKAA
jgi:sec-independent protein translocase protein TatA